jgi:hypothetical protein
VGGGAFFSGMGYPIPEKTPFRVVHFLMATLVHF